MCPLVSFKTSLSSVVSLLAGQIILAQGLDKLGSLIGLLFYSFMLMTYIYACYALEVTQFLML